MKTHTSFILGMMVVIIINSIQPIVAQDSKKKLTLKDTQTHHPFLKYPRGVKWLANGKEFTYLKRNPKTLASDLYKYDAKSGKEAFIVSNNKLLAVSSSGSMMSAKKLSLREYYWLPRESGLIIVDKGDIFHYSRTTRKLKRLTETEATEEEVSLSPDGQYIAFIREKNLFVVSVADGKEIQLTNDGSKTISNGKFDWLYQEELIGRGVFRAYYWSPNSDKIAYLQFDESPAPQYPLVDWQPYHPETEFMCYPKAGDPNSIVKLGVVGIDDPKTTWVDTGVETDVYFPRVYWLPSGDQLAFMRLDRVQQNLEFLFADPVTGKSKVIVKESDPYWVNIGDYVYFFKNKKRFVWGSERSGYNHLYLYDYNGKLIKQLTNGAWFVDKLSGVNEKRNLIYFTATEKDIRERHLYRVSTSGKKFKRLSRSNGNHSVKMAPGGKFYLDYFSSTEVSFKATVHDEKGLQHGILKKDDRELLDEYQLAKQDLFTFKGENGIEYYASMMKPLNFNPDKKYPVLIYVYGGPHNQVVRNYGIGNLWHHFLAQNGYIVFSMDNRGAAGRGHSWETPIYKNMGKVELEDQLRGVEYLKSLPYVDSRRIGIYGMSYGGYMTLYALTHSRAFRAGISVSPVTDWRYYDTAYTERYLGLPQENPEGYKASSPVNAADSLHGELLLIHGTYDDNVHVQNSIQMISALIDAGKQFKLMLYPKQGHGVHGVKKRLHLYRMMTDFLDQHLKGPEGK